MSEDPRQDERPEERDNDMGVAADDDLARAESLAAEVEELRAQLQRAHADYQNQRRRSLADVEHGIKRSLQPLLENLLLVLDHLDMALAAPAKSEDARALAQGVEMTRRQLVTALESQSVEPIAESGRFDPELHQAVAQFPAEGRAPGEILETVRRGFTWRGGVLRHAHVVVAAESPAQGRGEPMES